MAEKLIDFHVHLVGNGCCQSGIQLGEKFQKRPVFRYLKWIHKITSKQMMNDLDDLWVKRSASLVTEAQFLSGAVVLALDKPYDLQGKTLNNDLQLFIPNTWSKQAHDSHPQQLLFGASVHPYRPDALEELSVCVKNSCYLIKWLPSVMGIDPSHPRCIPFYDALREYKVPLLSHTDTEHTFAAPQRSWIDWNHVRHLKTALERGVTVIAAHAGTPHQLDEILKLAKQYDRFFVDTSGLFNPGRARSSLKLAQMAQSGVLKERILYASDWPVPVFPSLVIDKIGLKNYFKIAKLSNPFLRDLKIKEALNLSLENFKKNQDALLTSCSISLSKESLQ